MEDEKRVIEFLKSVVPNEYKEGIYGVDVGLTDKNVLHVIEINRNAGFEEASGWQQLYDFTGINVPFESMKLLSGRARR